MQEDWVGGGDSIAGFHGSVGTERKAACGGAASVRPAGVYACFSGAAWWGKNQRNAVQFPKQVEASTVVGAG